MRIDHVIYGTADLDVAAARVQERLGLTVIAGGRHDGQGTHNRIVPLGDGSYVELLAIADPQEAQRSPVGSAVQAIIERGDGLLGWAVGVEDVDVVARRLGTTVTTVGRQGMTARLTGVAEALAEPSLAFFIERRAERRSPLVAGAPDAISWIEVAGDARRIERWLGEVELPVRVVDGEPGVRAIGIGERELRAL